MDTINIKKDILRSIYSTISSLFNQSQQKNSTASATSIVIKPAPGKLYKLVAFNGNAAARYIQLHDAVSLPSNGAVPVAVFQVAAGGTLDFPIHNIKGLNFTTGIVACNSTTAATLTVGSADSFFHAIFV